MRALLIAYLLVVMLAVLAVTTVGFVVYLLQIMRPGADLDAGLVSLAIIWPFASALLLAMPPVITLGRRQWWAAPSRRYVTTVVSITAGLQAVGAIALVWWTLAAEAPAWIPIIDIVLGVALFAGGWPIARAAARSTATSDVGVAEGMLAGATATPSTTGAPSSSGAPSPTGAPTGTGAGGPAPSDPAAGTAQPVTASGRPLGDADRRANWRAIWLAAGISGAIAVIGIIVTVVAGLPPVFASLGTLVFGITVIITGVVVTSRWRSALRGVTGGDPGMARRLRLATKPNAVIEPGSEIERRMPSYSYVMAHLARTQAVWLGALYIMLISNSVTQALSTDGLSSFNLVIAGVLVVAAIVLAPFLVVETRRFERASAAHPLPTAV